MARGHIRSRGKGTWAVVVEMERDRTGGRRQKWHSIKGTKRDAERYLVQILHHLDTGQYVEPSRLTVAAYLDQWLAHGAHHQGATRERYESCIHLHLKPRLGCLRLTRLTPLEIQSCYTHLAASGSARGGGLAGKSLRLVHTVLHQALDQAVRWRMIDRNPADAVTIPTTPVCAINPPGAQQIKSLLEQRPDDWLGLAILVAVATGMRRGEILGVRWSDIDLRAKRLSVQQAVTYSKQGVQIGAPKTPKSRRPVDLPSLVVEALQRHRGRQCAEHELVLCRDDGKPITPSVLTRSFRELLRDKGLMPFRFHDLRHAHATLLLEQGAHPKIVSERLGHSRVGITLDRYSHALPHLQKQVVERFDADLRRLLDGEPACNPFADPSPNDRKGANSCLPDPTE